MKDVTPSYRWANVCCPWEYPTEQVKAKIKREFFIGQ